MGICGGSVAIDCFFYHIVAANLYILPLTSLGLPFTASQIDKVELSRTDVLLAVIGRLAPLEVDGEDRVTPRGVRVHECRPCRPILPASFHQTFAVGYVLTGML